MEFFSLDFASYVNLFEANSAPLPISMHNSQRSLKQSGKDPEKNVKCDIDTVVKASLTKWLCYSDYQDNTN